MHICRSRANASGHLYVLTGRRFCHRQFTGGHRRSRTSPNVASWYLQYRVRYDEWMTWRQWFNVTCLERDRNLSAVRRTRAPTGEVARNNIVGPATIRSPRRTSLRRVSRSAGPVENADRGQETTAPVACPNARAFTVDRQKRQSRRRRGCTRPVADSTGLSRALERRRRYRRDCFSVRYLCFAWVVALGGWHAYVMFRTRRHYRTARRCPQLLLLLFCSRRWYFNWFCTRRAPYGHVAVDLLFTSLSPPPSSVHRDPTWERLHRATVVIEITGDRPWAHRVRSVRFYTGLHCSCYWHTAYQSRYTCTNNIIIKNSVFVEYMFYKFEFLKSYYLNCIKVKEYETNKRSHK